MEININLQKLNDLQFKIELKIKQETIKMKRKIGVITGASKGIGHQLAVDLANDGYTLGLVARSENELNELVKSIGNPKAIAFVGSVADEAFAKEVIATMVNQFGKIDLLVNNAGYGIFGPTESYSAEAWSDLYDTNVKGTFLFCKEVLPIMKSQNQGHIINVASDVAKRVFDGGSLYCSSKFAQDAFSAALRKEVRKNNIKVSVVYSGLVDTPFHPGGNDRNGWLSPQDMSDSIRHIIHAPAHVVIDELMIHPLNQDY